MTYVLKDTSKGNEREFETEAEAKERKSELRGLGAAESDLEIIENGEEPPEEESTQSESESKESTAAEIIDEDDRPENPERVTESAYENLPDRSLTDDPIQWLQRGSDEFVTNIKGTDVITKKGFRVLEHFYEIDVGSKCVSGPEENGHEYCRVKAMAEMPDGRTAEAYGSAHVDRGDDHFLLMEMADTRAKSRVLSDITGCGAVAVEEMEGVEDR